MGYNQRLWTTRAFLWGLGGTLACGRQEALRARLPLRAAGVGSQAWHARASLPRSSRLCPADPGPSPPALLATLPMTLSGAPSGQSQKGKKKQWNIRAQTAAHTQALPVPGHLVWVPSPGSLSLSIPNAFLPPDSPARSPRL